MGYDITNVIPYVIEQSPRAGENARLGSTVRITVAVEPDAENRVLRVEADGDQYFRASKMTLSGDGEKRLHTLEFKNLPAGNYMLRAEVLTSDAVRGQATQELFVTSSGGR